ncbi:MAG: hypothetical protein AAF267_05090, partial [Deinococcota bacterium]
MLELRLFDPQTATDADFRDRYDCLRQKWQEEMPDDPVASLEFCTKDALGWESYDSTDFEVWYLWEADKVIAE